MYPIPINRPISLQSKATHNNSAPESRQDILIQALLWFASPPTNDLVWLFGSCPQLNGSCRQPHISPFTKFLQRSFVGGQKRVLAPPLYIESGTTSYSRGFHCHHLERALDNLFIALSSLPQAMVNKKRRACASLFTFLYLNWLIVLILATFWLGQM